MRNISLRLAEERSWVLHRQRKEGFWRARIPHTLTAIARMRPTSSRPCTPPVLMLRCSSGVAGSKCGVLLYVDIKACVAKLMTCARQLESGSYQSVTWVHRMSLDTWTHFTRRFLTLNFFPVEALMCTANSRSMVPLFLALSQVTWPI